MARAGAVYSEWAYRITTARDAPDAALCRKQRKCDGADVKTDALVDLQLANDVLAGRRVFAGTAPTAEPVGGGSYATAAPQHRDAGGYSYTPHDDFPAAAFATDDRGDIYGEPGPAAPAKPRHWPK